MAGVRVVEPEWLDILPPEHPRAVRSRRDLVRVNALMGNPRIVRGELRRIAALRSVAEIGCGSGEFLLGVVEGTALDVSLVDVQPVVAGETVDRFAWLGHRATPVVADVFDWLADAATPSQDAIVANLFLHHFPAPRLAELLSLASRKTRNFIACEPRRSPVSLAGASLLGLVGCNDVTRHDAVVSVRAGFGDAEISALWPGGAEWTIREGAQGLFSHVFVATRRPP